jgi:hypothetical protein
MPATARFPAAVCLHHNTKPREQVSDKFLNQPTPGLR